MRFIPICFPLILIGCATAPLRPPHVFYDASLAEKTSLQGIGSTVFGLSVKDGTEELSSIARIVNTSAPSMVSVGGGGTPYQQALMRATTITPTSSNVVYNKEEKVNVEDVFTSALRNELSKAGHTVVSSSVSVSNVDIKVKVLQFLAYHREGFKNMGTGEMFCDLKTEVVASRQQKTLNKTISFTEKVKPIYFLWSVKLDNYEFVLNSALSRFIRELLGDPDFLALVRN